ncbi:MAG: hypothetical protein M0Q49_06450 [Porticoccaceae bacterium]|nr:hypothetical protein [Porticoccaceae bacterium]
MAQRNRNRILYAALEDTYGVAEVLTSADAVKTQGLELLRYAGNRVSQDYNRAGLGNDREINVNPHAGFSAFRVPLIGSGNTETAPAWGRLLRACAMAETDDTAAKDEWYYTPVDGNYESLTCIGVEEFIQQQTTGVRGNWGLSLNSGELPWITFSNFLGSYARPVAKALNNPDNTAFKDAVPVTFANTTEIKLNGVQHAVSGFTFDGGITVVRDSMAGREESTVDDRRPTGTIIVGPKDAPATIALMALLETHAGATDAPITITHGAGAGNIIKFSVVAASFGEPSEQVVNGETFFSLPFSPQPVGEEYRLTQAAA